MPAKWNMSAVQAGWGRIIHGLLGKVIMHVASYSNDMQWLLTLYTVVALNVCVACGRSTWKKVARWWTSQVTAISIHSIGQSLRCSAMPWGYAMPVQYEAKGSKHALSIIDSTKWTRALSDGSGWNWSRGSEQWWIGCPWNDHLCDAKGARAFMENYVGKKGTERLLIESFVFSEHVNSLVLTSWNAKGCCRICRFGQRFGQRRGESSPKTRRERFSLRCEPHVQH